MVSSRSNSPAGGTRAGRVLAVDYGRRRMGLAVSDELGLTARPLATLERTNRRDDLRRLRELIRVHHVRRVVVGLPLHLDGGESDMAAEARRFAARLHKGAGLPVTLVDERLTSWEAEQTGSAPAKTPRRRRAQRDQLAAALILRDYLDQQWAAPNVRGARRE